MANRFAYGHTPPLRSQISAAASPAAWFEKQLNYAAIPDTRADTFEEWFPTVGFTAAEHIDRQNNGSGWSWQVRVNEARWTLLRRIHSQRQVHEVMTEFWQNHFHVAAGAELTWVWRHDYDKLVRRHALGRFDQMLKAALVHPAMLIYLDADESHVHRRVRPNGDVEVTEEINENLGRELLELHTVGGGAGFDEADVLDSSYILTGWMVNNATGWVRRYEPQRHYTGPVSVLGFTAANDELDGRQVLSDYLDYLAHHPATAQRIARKLAIQFVSDDPSQGLVDHLAQVFLQSGTDIKTTLRALVASREFKDAIGDKVRTPTDDVVATFRALRATIMQPQKESDAANVLYLLSQTIGSTPYSWPRPDGQPANGEAWSSAARLLGSYRVHNSIAGQWSPSTGIRYKSPASWLPERKIRFDLLVDHMCRRMFGRPVTSRLLGAACIVVDIKPGEVITSEHSLVQWKMPRLIGLLLDSPQHLKK